MDLEIREPTARWPCRCGRKGCGARGGQGDSLGGRKRGRGPAPRPQQVEPAVRLWAALPSALTLGLPQCEIYQMEK